MNAPPLIAHIIHRLEVGGLENGLVNLINRMPEHAYRHAIVCLRDYTDFSQRIRRPDVTLHALHKRPGKDVGLYLRLWRVLRALRPAIVHTRNLATLEAQVVAALAGVRARIHGEHGWDLSDLDGRNRKHLLLRRAVRPLVGAYVALSQHQWQYLVARVGVAPARIERIVNGVDVARFRPAVSQDAGQRSALLEMAAVPPDALVIGTVMRLQPVKAPDLLLEAFLRLLAEEDAPGVPRAGSRAYLIIVGDGPLLPALRARLFAAGAGERVYLAGARDEVAAWLRAFDLFVMPSWAEGICNTILEAMATGLPIIATRVGGNPDLIEDGVSGQLIPAGDVDALTAALRAACADPERRQAWGRAARQRAEQLFSLDTMVARYQALYDRMLSGWKPRA